MILPAQIIRKLSQRDQSLIYPFCERTRFNGVTHGLSPNGYDLRIAQDIILYPGAAVDVDTIEYLNIPNDICGRPEIKSTWARWPYRMSQVGTNVDAGWEGIFRCEIHMHPTARPPQIPLILKAGTGVIYILFERLEEPTEQPYEGKFQRQGHNQDAILEEGYE